MWLITEKDVNSAIYLIIHVFYLYLYYSERFTYEWT